MDYPVVVEVERGSRVESRHRGAGAVLDERGVIVFSFGDIDRPVFPRSAVKAFQALPLVESGIAEQLGFDDAQIALACSSHSGEPVHTRTAAAMLAAVGRDVQSLECGTHWPSYDRAARGLAAEGREPCALHNNCSGKHAGFVCLACAQGDDPAGYVRPDHSVQRQVKAALEDMTGAGLDSDACGIDGCSIPTYAIPLRGLAQGFARFGTGHGLSSARAAAAQRIRQAAAAQPHMIAGSGRFDTEVMGLLGARAFTKGGAEGVFCGAIPDAGLGFAVKADDGAGRAAEVMTAAILQRFCPLDETLAERLAAFRSPVLRNWNGIEVGRLRPAGPLG